MSKTSLILILLLLFVIGSFLAIIYSSFTPLSSNPASFHNKTSPASQPYLLSFNTLPLQTGQIITVEVLIGTQAIPPNVIQLEIGYDPAVLTVSEVVPGNFFTTPTILLNRLTLPGRISYALSCPSASQLNSTPTPCINQATNKVAIITFLVNRSLINKETVIKFLPKTLIQTTETKIPLTTHDATVVIPGLFVPQAPTSTTSGIIAH